MDGASNVIQIAPPVPVSGWQKATPPSRTLKSQACDIGTWRLLVSFFGNVSFSSPHPSLFPVPFPRIPAQGLGSMGLGGQSPQRAWLGPGDAGASGPRRAASGCRAVVPGHLSAPPLPPQAQWPPPHLPSTACCPPPQRNRPPQGPSPSSSHQADGLVCLWLLLPSLPPDPVEAWNLLQPTPGILPQPVSHLPLTPPPSVCRPHLRCFHLNNMSLLLFWLFT